MFRGELLDSGRMRHFENIEKWGGWKILPQVDPQVSQRKKSGIFPQSGPMEVENADQTYLNRAQFCYRLFRSEVRYRPSLQNHANAISLEIPKLPDPSVSGA